MASMGYNQSWEQECEIDADIFGKIVEDFGRIVLVLDDLGVRLAGPLGEGTPVLTPDEISFNGVADCGHPQNEEISLPAAAPRASGVGGSTGAIVGEKSWHVLLQRRTCDGNCSFETFTLERLSSRRPDDGSRLPCGDVCKTGFRPYDLAVQCALLIAKHYLRDRFSVHTAGSDYVWNDPRQLCYLSLQYPLREFRVDEENCLVQAG